MDNRSWIHELMQEIGELEMLIAKASQGDEPDMTCGASMLKRILRRRRQSLWSYQRSGSHGAH